MHLAPAAQRPPASTYSVRVQKVSTDIAGLAAVAKLVCCIATGGLPDPVLHLIPAATLLHLQLTPDKTHLIAVSSIFCRILTKVLLLVAVDDSRDFLALYRTPDGITAGMDPLVRDTCTILRSVSTKPIVAAVFIDVRNEFPPLTARQSLLSSHSTHPLLADSSA